MNMDAALTPLEDRTCSLLNTTLAEELPLFCEKYPDKVCCLCNLSERSSLGQGELLCLSVPTGLRINKTERSKADEAGQTPSSKASYNSKYKSCIGESNYELDKIGHSAIMHVLEFYDEDNIYVHQMCAMWSVRKSSIQSAADISHFLTSLEQFLEQKCSFCGQYGASVICKMNCQQIHHWPCAAAAGCLLILESFTVFCTEHLSQVPLICNDSNVECVSCSSLGDLSKLIMCCVCGDHFHSTCIGLANLPDTRSGWSCARCTKCQICRLQDSNAVRFVKCEQCQKMYHATCLKPVISSIPKYGWKCHRCRVCTDCGSRTPGGGSSSRWHSHYTICDSCYQQRNKGFSCPICQKAYRAAAFKEMVKCNWCQKFVHSACDEEADLGTYHKKKENNPDYDYICPNCKVNSSGSAQIQPVDSFELSLAESNLSDVYKDKLADLFDEKSTAEISIDELQKITSNKKKICQNSTRGKGGKFVLHRMGVLSQIGRKRSSRGKGRQLVLSSGSSDRCIIRNMDMDLASDKKMLLCSARDKFIVMEDICVMCGSLGIESDSAMITCAQCGHCYHPYCASVKPSKGMQQKGWRCLDCTVCEGCGKKNDEARLLLCDDCDISYHIYCVDPPLESVPHGNWKCSYCTLCLKCGRNPTEKNECNDMNMPECPPCTSQTCCAVCKKFYSDGEMIIQCERCEHWSHFLCDSVNNYLTIEYYETNQYLCSSCRCKGVKLELPSEKVRTDDKICLQKQLAQPVHDGKSITGTERKVLSTNDLLDNASTEAIHWIDGVCLSENGLNLIKSLSTEVKRKRKLRQPIGNSNKDPLIDSALLDELQSDKYKDGMVWDCTEASIPEGFTISTNDEGVNILRKKRQRNLQKLGIGGFSVRNRALKKDNDDCSEQLNAALSLDKKKKIIRKKQKNKLIEAYPAYLQEAFFGRPLLKSSETLAYESDSNDEIDSSTQIFFSHSTNDADNSLKQPLAEKPPKVEPLMTQQNGMQVIRANAFTMPAAESANNVTTSIHHPIDNSQSTNAAQVVGQKNAMINFGTTAECVDKIISKPAVVQMENCAPQQMPHGQMYMPGKIMNSNAVKYEQQQQENLNMQNKLKAMKDDALTVDMQIDKRSIEERKSNESYLEVNVGTQKTAEKMRRDEDLGLMATISAVLYANTEHANLKDLYPNWNVRCKQILKRWRALSNEKKAPFLQKAKDNRSALRHRREQGKISLSPKIQRQDAWKQVKLKENHTNTMYSNYSGMQFDAGFGSKSQKASAETMIVHQQFIDESAMQKPLVMLPKDPIGLNATHKAAVDINLACRTNDIGHKKLRNLLQKPNSEAIMTDTGSEVFFENPDLRLGLVSNASLQENNPMLGINQEENLSQANLEQNQPDLKMIESQEVMSSSVGELENVGFGDILGGLGEGDDDDLLKSLTSEIGDDFNILEYADPELDVNVLNTLDFEENDKMSA